MRFPRRSRTRVCIHIFVVSAVMIRKVGWYNKIIRREGVRVRFQHFLGDCNTLVKPLCQFLKRIWRGAHCHLHPACHVQILHRFNTISVLIHVPTHACDLWVHTVGALPQKREFEQEVALSKDYFTTFASFAKQVGGGPGKRIQSTIIRNSSRDVEQICSNMYMDFFFNVTCCFSGSH